MIAGLNDRINIHTADGKNFYDVMASVQRKEIILEAQGIPIRPGDEVTRTTSAGVEEKFIIIDPGFQKGNDPIPDLYHMVVRRADANDNGNKAAQQDRDESTGLLSKKEFIKSAPKLFEETQKKQRPLSLIMGDVDHFKKVNDTRGHPIGDAVLREVAARIMNCVAGKGQAFRFGGEEIVIILQNHTTEEGLTVAERCRKNIEGSPMSEMNITMSFGVATSPDHASDLEKLMKASDDALYDAKHRGRNLVRLSGEPIPTEPGPRQPDRKTAPLGKLTDQEIAAVRQRILRGERPECPKDHSFLIVNDFTPLSADPRRYYMVQCPECGLMERV